MKELIHSQDRYQMNWIEGAVEWGTVQCVLPLDVQVLSKKEGDIVREEYIFTNNTDKDIFTQSADIGIYTPFHDEYVDAAECMTNRCHTHIWCGGEVTYIMALRMGGEAPHLGLVLNKGAISGYSVERDMERMSNDRGDFILHPSPFSLAPGESYTVAWTLFFHNGKEDFYEKASIYCNKFLTVHADKYVMFKGEASNIEIKANFAVASKDVQILLHGEKADFAIKNHSVMFQVETGMLQTPGEIIYEICVGGVHTCLRLLVLPALDELMQARCRFIAQKQQYHNENSRLDGAYLIYDNEEEALYYSPLNDYNGGRERVGMGILLALYLQKEQDEAVENSLRKYAEYVKRELVNEGTGEVYNDYGRDNSYKRLYNAPWYALFYVELYKLYQNRSDLQTAYKIIRHYYENGGAQFYPIELPSVEIIECMKAEKMEDEIRELMGQLIRHADYISETGTNYPSSEVNYEQSIVAPAADILLKTYKLTKDEKYLNAAKRQIDVLALFHGLQPDYHLYEVAIRHWDGYWFGKRKMYGDTFPHYWSALTANVYYAYAEVTGDEAYGKEAESVYRGTLSMFMPDGRASCAYVYPVTVNGRKAEFYDPYANDQDWGLYFMLKNRMHRMWFGARNNCKAARSL